MILCKIDRLGMIVGKNRFISIVIVRGGRGACKGGIILSSCSHLSNEREKQGEKLSLVNPKGQGRAIQQIYQ